MVHILIGLVFAATSREMRQAQRWHFSSALWRVGWGWRGELGGESCSFLFSKHTAKLNGWSINFSGIDLHQFCLHAHTRSHFIVNQSFWKHLTEGPVLTNKPSIPAACVAPLSGHKSAAAQTSAPFPSLSPPASLCLLSPLCPYRLSCFDVWVSGMEKRGERPGFFTTPLKITQG